MFVYDFVLLINASNLANKNRTCLPEGRLARAEFLLPNQIGYKCKFRFQFSRCLLFLENSNYKKSEVLLIAVISFFLYCGHRMVRLWLVREFRELNFWTYT